MTDFIRQAQAGDIEAFVALMEQQKQGFYRVAKSYLRNDEDVADAMQDTVLACFEKLGQLREPKHFKTWATRILINICLKRGRAGFMLCFNRLVDPSQVVKVIVDGNEYTVK